MALHSKWQYRSFSSAQSSWQSRCLWFFLVLVLVLASTQSWAYQVLIVQSRPEPALEEALAGFRTARLSDRVIVLSQFGEVDIVRLVREERPALVLAIGDSAALAVRRVRHTPVIYLMALSFPSRDSGPANAGGVGMIAPPERYLNLFRVLKRRRVGVLYHPEKTGWYLRQARQAAQRMDIELVLREVSEPRMTLAQLDSLRGVVDSLWMLPDTAAVTRETAEAYFRFSQEEEVPVVSFAPPYLKLGAAAVLELDRTDLGRQAGEMAVAILKGADIQEFSPAMPRRTLIKYNPSVLKNLGIPADIFTKVERES